MTRVKRISPRLAALRLLFLLLMAVVPFGTQGLGLSTVTASEETTVDATPVGPEPPPDDGIPGDGEVEPTAEPIEIVPTETSTAPPTEVMPTASAPADTPTPLEGSPVPTPDSTPELANALTCDEPVDATILPGETYDLSCLYAINNPDDLAGVAASFAAVPGAGWLVMVVPAEETGGARPIAAHADWIPEADQTAGSARELTVRVLAPSDATLGQIATVQVELDGGAAPAASVDLSVDAGDFSVASVETVEGVRCSTYSSARPLGWNQVIIYACTFDPGIATLPNNSFVRYSFDDGADETASWGLGSPTLDPASLPGTRYPGTSLPGTILGGMSAPLTVYFPIWTPFSEDDATDAAGTISLFVPCVPELQCSSGFKTFSARFSVAIGESSSQNGDASLTCVPADGGASYPVSYTSPAELDCTVEALVDNLQLQSLGMTPPSGWGGTVTRDGGLSLPMSLAKGDAYSFTVRLEPRACTITSASPSITIFASARRGTDDPRSVRFDTTLTAAPSDVLRPASAYFDLSSLDFGTGSWNETAAGSIVSGVTVQPPSCLPAGTTQHVSLSITGNGSSFRSSTGGTLALSQLELADVYSDTAYPDTTARPTGPAVALTTSPEIVSITAAGETPRWFWTVLTLVAPPGTPPGVYSATITLEITGGGN